MLALSWVLFVLLSLAYCLENSDLSKQRLDPHKMLEGITEPFDVELQSNLPAWKILKNAADFKASGEHLQQALKEYGYILRHPHLFSEMPSEDRYDIFLSMAKLLKIMGFHQRAEVLLYESIGYSQSPFETHFQLALLSLEREDLTSAKMHLKNCLYLKESDTLVLIHFAVILMAEGKTHEAKFYISRILSALEGKVQRLVEVMKNSDNTMIFGSKSNTVPEEKKDAGNIMSKWNRKRSRSKLATDAPELMDGDSVFAPFNRRVEHVELQQWLEDMMVRVFHGDYLTTLLEKDASTNKGGMFYNPTKTSNLLETFQMFSNLYDWLADGEMTGRFVFDIGQSLYESGKSEVGQYMMSKGHASSNPVLEGLVSVEIVKIRLALDYPMIPTSLGHVIEAYLNTTQYLSLSSSSYEPIDLENVLDVYWPVPLFPFSGLFTGPILTELMYRFKGGPIRRDSPSVQWLADSLLSHTPDADRNNHAAPITSSTKHARIEVGIFGGHMNNHPVGLMVLHRLLALDKSLFRITLVATPLHADHITKDIASNVDEIVNIPMATDRAWQIIEQKLHLDILLLPDWQPFPDQLNILYASRRIAPIQICFFVRGSTCGSGSNIDYYLLPEDVQEHYLKSTSVNYAISSAKNPDGSPTVGKRSGGAGVNQSISIPPWLESFHEQVVVIDWPIFTSHVVANAFKSVAALIDDSAPTNVDTTSRSKGGAVDAKAATHRLTTPDYSQLIETEGQIFFDNQPVAIIATHPSYVHPLMDSVLIRILKETAASQLQILLVLPEIHFNDAMRIPKYRISWARRLVRRLWLKAGSLSNRIRLLPSPVSDKRLLALYRQADMVLDTFPLGSSLHSHSIALSVGTPVVTMRPGLVLHTPMEELAELKQSLVLLAKKYEKNPVFQYIMKHDVPWVPTNGQLAAYYERLSHQDNVTYKSDGVRNSVEDMLVANSISDYELIVRRLATDKEAAYKVRVKLLEAIDMKWDHEMRAAGHAAPSGSVGRNTRNYSAATELNMNEHLEQFLVTVGRKYAVMRADRVAKLSPPSHEQARLHQQQEQRRLSKQRYHEMKVGGNMEEVGGPFQSIPGTRPGKPGDKHVPPIAREKDAGKAKPVPEEDSRKNNGYFRNFLHAWIA